MFRLVFLGLLSFLIVGCVNQTRPYITVKAISSESFKSKTYVILPDNETKANENQLLYNQLVKSTEQALSVRGYRRVNDIHQSAQVIFLGYGRTGAISQTRDVTVPIYGQTGVSSATTYGTANTNYSGYGNSLSTINTSTVYTPTYGITGAYNTTVTDTFYTVMVSLKSVDYAQYMKDKRIVDLWNVQAFLTAEQADGLATFRELIIVAVNYADTTLDKDLTYFGDNKLFGLE